MDFLLSDTNTYEKLNRDPTATYKRELIDIIRKRQKEDPIPQPHKDHMHPTAEETPKMYGLPQIHKASASLQPIVASWGSITYNAARVLADLLSPFVGKTEHHIQNSGDFVNKVKDLEVPPGQKLVSYDVSALFTSIPMPDAIAAIEGKLNSDLLLHEHTPPLPQMHHWNAVFPPECHVLLVQKQHL